MIHFFFLPLFQLHGKKKIVAFNETSIQQVCTISSTDDKAQPKEEDGSGGLQARPKCDRHAPSHFADPCSKIVARYSLRSILPFPHINIFSTKICLNTFVFTKGNMVGGSRKD
jgi:hypothetical protein